VAIRHFSKEQKALEVQALSLRCLVIIYMQLFDIYTNLL